MTPAESPAAWSRASRTGPGLAAGGWRERPGPGRLARDSLLIAGRWTDYQVSFTWMHDIEALQLDCAFEIKVPERRKKKKKEIIFIII